MRHIVIIALALIQGACQGLTTASDTEQQLEALLEFQQSLQQRDASELQLEAARLRTLHETGEVSASQQLQLALVETELAHLNTLHEQHQNQQALRGQIQSLAEQIQALTAIEQQIIRRGQQQEINDD